MLQTMVKSQTLRSLGLTAQVHYGKPSPFSEASAIGRGFRENEKPHVCLSVGVTSFVTLPSIFLIPIILILIFLITKLKKKKSPFGILPRGSFRLPGSKKS